MKRLFFNLAAFSLVEVTLALSVAAFCLIAVFGLVPIGVQTNRNATSQTAAASIIRTVVSDLRGTPRCVATSSQYQIIVGTGPVCGSVVSPSPKTLYFDSTGQFSTSPGTNSRYQLNVTWNVTGGCSAALPCADIKVTWPPIVVQSSPTPVPSGSVEICAAFDRN
jgi:uncharacterized protein (TIGR02598 family)